MSTNDNHLCYTSTIEQNVINANNQINQNCGFPSDGTTSWAIVKKAYNQELWYITQPPENGWNQFTQSQMIAGIVDVDVQSFDAAWWPPSPPFPPGN